MSEDRPWQVLILATCRECEESFLIPVSSSGYYRWMSGELIQRALPELTSGERELLINEVCGTCYDKLFEEPTLEV